ncbi:methylated-DNA--[protein]-cysteine S-methyltransferase, partial [bacterium]|nr:methylated-DNA--[protein]-cysteine S-methyltransferase [bacterium]
TEFQKKVWLELSKIAHGSLCTYKDIAIAIGNEKAVRAVGMANSKNPIPIIIPCHRVIGSNGKLTGFAHGLAMKEKLIQLEKLSF